MHQLNVLIYGPDSFLSTLNELKPFLKFNYNTEILEANYDIILFYDEILDDPIKKNLINKSETLKICATSKKKLANNWDGLLQLPTTIKEINAIIESIVAKKEFTKNSSIKVKNYFLNKNEKKLSLNFDAIILTEKEIQLIELLLKNTKPISKGKILSLVWNYSTDADTHTVETHIYRLRKKISEKFKDDKFIINSKDGYYL